MAMMMKMMVMMIEMMMAMKMMMAMVEVVVEFGRKEEDGKSRVEGKEDGMRE